MLSPHELDRFSIKDLIALLVLGTYGYQVFAKDYRMVDLMTEPVLVILGGYFVSEGYAYIQRVRQRRASATSIAPEPTFEEVDRNGPF